MIAAAPVPSLADTDPWQVLQAGEAVVLLRHASAPGGGDPPGFRIDDCASQRNLSEAGREEARRIGEALRARQVPIARVVTSRWCRCRETAALAFGAAQPNPILDSLHGRAAEAPARTEALRAVIGEWRGAGGNLVLVTHHANILALTGVAVGSGEMLVVRPGDLSIAGRIPVAALSAR